ncbi:MAG TPA: 50S ribosomal protein L11 methyltransferase [Gammaproteobacteria bacterium]|nr:50S ribosomal protein L11 methyltransferase [Gammaproteobacteria bacterium]
MQIDFPLNGLDAEQVEDALLAAGAAAVTYRDAADDPVFEPWPGEMPLWQQTRVTGMFPADADVDGIRAVLLAALELEHLPPHRVEILEDRDWTREWLKDFRPLRFGRRLWVVPTAYEPPEPEAVNLVLDPGLAFGTGTHPTTALCLEWLDGQPLEGASVVDYGCGSGILAVAAALLGAEDILATDIDPQALLATRDNAARNGVAERIRTCLPGELGDAGEGTSDVVLANILAGPLVELAPRIVRLLRGNGRLVLSGLLRSQAGEVAEAYRALGIQLAIDGELDGWVRLAGRK